MKDIPISPMSATLKVQLLVVEHGEYAFGISACDFLFGGAPIEGIAMYSKHDGEEDRWVTNDWDNAETWFRNHGADDEAVELLKLALEASKADGENR